MEVLQGAHLHLLGLEGSDPFHRAAIDYAVTTVTTLAGARAAVEGIAALQAQELQVRALQDIHG